MLKVIEEQAAIKKYAGQFNKKFKSFIDEEIKVKLGHQGAGFPAKEFMVEKPRYLEIFPRRKGSALLECLWCGKAGSVQCSFHSFRN